MATKKSTLNENSKPSFEITETDFQTSTYNAGVSTHRARSRSFTKGDVLMGRMPAPPAPSRIGRRELIVPRPDKRPVPIPPTQNSSQNGANPSPEVASEPVVQQSLNENERNLHPTTNSNFPGSQSLRLKPTVRPTVPPRKGTLESSSSSNSNASNSPRKGTLESSNSTPSSNNLLPQRPNRPPPSPPSKEINTNQ
jgi:hypothetical protein